MSRPRPHRAAVAAALALAVAWLAACGGGRAIPVEPEYDWPDAAATLAAPPAAPADAGAR